MTAIVYLSFAGFGFEIFGTYIGWAIAIGLIPMIGIYTLRILFFYFRIKIYVLPKLILIASLFTATFSSFPDYHQMLRFFSLVSFAYLIFSEYGRFYLASKYTRLDLNPFRFKLLETNLSETEISIEKYVMIILLLLYGILMILFNPFLPFYFERTEWVYLDLISVIILSVSFFRDLMIGQSLSKEYQRLKELIEEGEEVDLRELQIAEKYSMTLNGDRVPIIEFPSNYKRYEPQWDAVERIFFKF